MNYREALEQTNGCPKCCKKALERYLKNQTVAAKPTEKDKKAPKG